MKVKIEKTCREIKGLFGGVKGTEYHVTLRVELTKEEEAILTKSSFAKLIFYTPPKPPYWTNARWEETYKELSQVTGMTVLNAHRKNKNELFVVETAVEAEEVQENIKKAMLNLKAYIEAEARPAQQTEEFEL